MRIARETTGVYEADIHLESASCSLQLVIESRGGAAKEGGTERNPEYIPALLALLERAKANGGLLSAAYIESERVETLTLEDRLLLPKSFPYPIDLRHVDNLDILRKSLGRAIADFASKRVRGGGNTTKRMRLVFELPLSHVELQRQLDLFKATN
jgi:hypothetical protein